MAGLDVGGPGPMPRYDPALSGEESWIRPFLSLLPVDIDELPSHPELPTSNGKTRTSVSQFIDLILTEVAKIDFDNGWVTRGEWHPKETDIHMPGLPDKGSPKSKPSSDTDAQISYTRPVPISVNQRVKDINEKTWLARTSFHLQTDIKYSELEGLLCQDHSRNECLYTPSVYEANELLAWSSEDLSRAVGEINHEFNVQGLQMSIFQMFHQMPDVLGGLHLLDDRVFHVLVITVHSTYKVPASESRPEASGIPQAYTIQLPIEIETYNNVPAITQKSHVRMKGSSRYYHFPSKGDTLETTDAQSKKTNRKVIEGKYVSLERLRQAPNRIYGNKTVTFKEPLVDSDEHHRWDMMTLSTAEGITRLAPTRIKEKEILNAIATDVYYVMKHIAKLR